MGVKLNIVFFGKYGQNRSILVQNDQTRPKLPINKYYRHRFLLEKLQLIWISGSLPYFWNLQGLQLMLRLVTVLVQISTLKKNNLETSRQFPPGIAWTIRIYTAPGNILPFLQY